MADIHIGAMSYKDTFDGILYIRDLLDSYTKDGPLDFIIIGGDYFDKQLYANDPFELVVENVFIVSLVVLINFSIIDVSSG